MKLRSLLLGAGFALLSAGTALATDPQLYFSRSDQVAKVLIREIDAAQKSVHVLIYSLTDDDVANALVRAAGRNVDVKVVMDLSQTAEKSSLKDFLTTKLGAKRVIERTGKGRGIMHEKMAVYDGMTVTLGSYNWTDGARDSNWENLDRAARCRARLQV